MIEDQKAFADVLAWLISERSYTITKFGTDADRRHTTEWMEKSGDGWWDQQLDNYLHRAFVLGLDTLVGRQALAKFVSTAAGMLAAAVQVYGPIPEAGVPSGEIR